MSEMRCRITSRVAVQVNVGRYPGAARISAIVEPKVAPSLCGLKPLDGQVLVEIEERCQHLMAHMGLRLPVPGSLLLDENMILSHL